MCGKASSSSSDNKNLTMQHASSLMSALSTCADKAKEAQSKAELAHTSIYNWALAFGSNNLSALFPLLSQIIDVQTLIQEIITGLAKSNGLITDIMGSGTTTIVPLNQPAFPSFPPGFKPHTQASIPQQNQIARFPSTSAGILFPHSYGNNQQQTQSSLHPPTFQPFKRAAICIPPSSSSTSYVPQHSQQAALPPTQVSAGILRGKRGLEALYGPNGEVPPRLRHIEANVMQHILSEIVDHDSTVKWGDIAGLDQVRTCVQESVVWPALNPKMFEGVGSLCKGILLFGPPGTGKTMIGKAIALEMKATFFNISAVSVLTKWPGDSDKVVRALFEVAKHCQPSVIFVDQIDTTLIRRPSVFEAEMARRFKTQLFLEMEGINSSRDQIIVVGATSRPQDVDEEARKRFNKRIYIPLPVAEARLAIVVKTMKKAGKELLLGKEDIDTLSEMTEGYSGSDMKKIVQEAMLGPVREMCKVANSEANIKGLKPEELKSVSLQDFQRAFKMVRPSVYYYEVGLFAEWNARFGSS